MPLDQHKVDKIRLRNYRILFKSIKHYISGQYNALQKLQDLNGRYGAILAQKIHTMTPTGVSEPYSTIKQIVKEMIEECKGILTYLTELDSFTAVDLKVYRRKAPSLRYSSLITVWKTNQTRYAYLCSVLHQLSYKSLVYDKIVAEGSSNQEQDQIKVIEQSKENLNEINQRKQQKSTGGLTDAKRLITGLLADFDKVPHAYNNSLPEPIRIQSDFIKTYERLLSQEPPVELLEIEPLQKKISEHQSQPKKEEKVDIEQQIYEILHGIYQITTDKADMDIENNDDESKD